MWWVRQLQVFPAPWELPRAGLGRGGEQAQMGGPLLVAELEGRTVQRVPQLHPAVTATQAFTPMLLALPAGLATQLHPTWVGGQVRSHVGAHWTPLPSSPPSHSPMKSSAVPRS